MVDSEKLRDLVIQSATTHAISAIALMLREKRIIDPSIMDIVADSCVATFNTSDWTSDELKQEYERQIRYMLGCSTTPPPRLRLIDGGKPDAEV